MRQKAKQRRLQREEEAAQEKPAFKLRQFENVPSRLHHDPRRPLSAHSRPSSAPVHHSEGANRSPSQLNDSMDESPGWRVSNGYGSLSSPPRPGLEPFAPVPSTPPRAAPKARCLSTPVKSPETVQASSARRSTPGKGAARTEDDGRFDVGNFERVAKQLKQQKGKSIPAKDAQGLPTHLQRQRGSPQGPLSHSGEHVQCAIPMGYRLMSDDERLDTLDALKTKLADLDDKYRRLPLRIETEGQRQQQRMLRTKIAEAEKALSVFSRPSVLVEV